MNGQELTEWRESLKTDLAEVKTDVKWIKENLGRLDERQSDLAKQVAWLKGLGSLVGIILGSVLALVSSVVFTGCVYEGWDRDDIIVEPIEQSEGDDPSALLINRGEMKWIG
jgi:hypothetical protein